MKNELKVNIVKHIEQIEALTQEYRKIISEKCKGYCQEARLLETQKCILKLEDQVYPIFDEIKDILNQENKRSNSKLDLIIIQKCIQRLESLYRCIHNCNLGQVEWRAKQFKSELEGLVDNDEQLHRTATKQSSTSKQRKE